MQTVSLRTVLPARRGPSPASRRTLAFIGLLLAGVVALWALWSPWRLVSGSEPDWVGLLALAVMTGIAQLTPIDIYGSGKVSGAAIIVLAGGFLYGIPGALLLGTEIALVQWLAGRGRLHRFLFDLAALSLSAAAGAAVSRLVDLIAPTGSSMWVVIPGLVSGFAFYLANIGLLSLVMGISEARSPARVWDERFRWLWVHYLVYGLLAGFIIVAYRAIGVWGLVVFWVPPLMLRYVMKQYVDRTETNVRKLTKANDDLSEAHQQVTQALDRLKESYQSTLLALSAALDSRDSDTEGHSQRVVAYSEAIAGKLGLEEQGKQALVQGALLHDVGKIGVPDAILRKNGPLTDDEWESMRAHTAIGRSMLSPVAFLRDALPVVESHHERFDGKGYPQGLRGEEIPLIARIFSVADTFDAMASDRPYRKACSVEVALEEIARCAGSQFDPRVVDALLQVDPAVLGRVSRQEPAEAALGTSFSRNRPGRAARSRSALNGDADTRGSRGKFLV